MSIGVSFGGQWKLKTHRPMSGTFATSASMAAAISASLASRGVSHGVYVESPTVIIVWSPSRSTSSPSQATTCSVDKPSITSSTDGSSSFPPVRYRRVPVPTSRSSASAIHPRSRSVARSWNRPFTASGSFFSSTYRSRSTTSQ